MREEVGFVEKGIFDGMAHVDEIDVVVFAGFYDAVDVFLTDKASEVRDAGEADCEPVRSVA